MRWITVTEDDEGTGERLTVGRFDLDKAERFSEAEDWGGNNPISVNTGSQWDHQELIRTARGRWVLHCYSNWQNSVPNFSFLDNGAACNWLIRNAEVAAAEKYFGPVEEVGPGRPRVGSPTNLRFPPELRERIDAAAEPGEAFAATVRRLLDQVLSR